MNIFDTPTDISAWLVGLLLLVGSARIVRLIAFDTYPPATWLRMKWDDRTHQSAWNELLHCAYCLAPWIVLINGAVGWATEWHIIWLAINAWLTVAYLAAALVAYDGDDA